MGGRKWGSGVRSLSQRERDLTPNLTPLWNALANEHRPADSDLPDTGIGLERERWLSPAFIRGDDYGTRASTVLLIDAAGRGQMHERRFGAQGVFLGESRVDF